MQFLVFLGSNDIDDIVNILQDSEAQRKFLENNIDEVVRKSPVFAISESYLNEKWFPLLYSSCSLMILLDRDKLTYNNSALRINFRFSQNSYAEMLQKCFEYFPLLS